MTETQKTQKTQTCFMLDECWTLTIAGAFKRANVYAGGTGDKERDEFREWLRDKLTDIAEVYRERAVSEEEHIQKIEALSTDTAQYSKKSILNDGRLNFGVSQKLLNLHLKYLWCIGQLTPEPPHFPVDRIIQEILGDRNPKPWTQMETSEDYRKIIEKAKEVAGGTSLAEWELQAWSKWKEENRQRAKKQAASVAACA